MDRVILADPYFSVSAAEKLLTRIPRTNLQLDIITCLGMTDPDTGKASDICKEYEKFLFSNAKLLPWPAVSAQFEAREQTGVS